ncbi:MAG: hypothetical protein OHK0047_10420 [Leptolyngbyaceae cyanobacterium]
MTVDLSAQYAVPPGSIKEYRYAVYFDGLALWKEKNPVHRANIAHRLAELMTTLAQMEAEEASKYKEQCVSPNEPA